MIICCGDITLVVYPKTLGYWKCSNSIICPYMCFESIISVWLIRIFGWQDSPRHGYENRSAQTDAFIPVANGENCQNDDYVIKQNCRARFMIIVSMWEPYRGNVYAIYTFPAWHMRLQRVIYIYIYDICGKIYRYHSTITFIIHMISLNINLNNTYKSAHRTHVMLATGN